MKRLQSAVAVALILGTLSGCATISAPRLAQSPALPQAAGTVQFRKSREHGTHISLRVRNLAAPEGLTPPGYAYVAWVQSDREAEPQNVGALVVDAKSDGVLKTTTPLSDFELFVTVEATADAARPSGPPLLWTHRDDWRQIALGERR
jgi:hypothetical protein